MTNDLIRTLALAASAAVGAIALGQYLGASADWPTTLESNEAAVVQVAALSGATPEDASDPEEASREF